MDRQQPTIGIVVRGWVLFCRLLAYSMNPYQKPSRRRDVRTFTFTDLENDPIFRSSQCVASRTELAMLVLEAVAVIFVERERPIAQVKIQFQRVERLLVGVSQVWTAWDNRPRTDVERHTLQRRVC